MNDAEIWRLIAIAAVGALAPMLGVVWNSLNKKFETGQAVLKEQIEDVRQVAMSALTKEEFDRELAQSLRDREALQRDVRELFGKVEATRDLVNAKVETARERMSEQIDKLRMDMNGGFNAIREDLRAAREGK
jgi:septation ring formation regulator EzrA